MSHHRINNEQALAMLGTPPHAIGALCLMISEFHKLSIDIGPRSNMRDVYVGYGHKTQFPDNFRHHRIGPTIEFGEQVYGSIDAIPASIFCATCGSASLLDIPGFDIPHLTSMARLFNRTYDASAASAIHEAQAILSSLRELEYPSFARTSAHPTAHPLEFSYACLMERDKFVYLLQRQDDLVDFLDLVENFPEMLEEDATKSVYRNTVAPLKHLPLGDNALERDVQVLLEKIDQGMQQNAPKATILPFRRKTADRLTI